MKKMLFTSESVTEGHPDKLADQISDSILDAILAQDPQGRVACETLVTTGQAHVVGEISTTCYVDIPKIIRQTVREVGYTNASYGFDADTCGILVSLDEQSPDIAQGVNQAIESREGKMDAAEAIGAGDQGMMFGYATNETPEYMPLTTVLAHKLARRLTDVRKSGELKYLRPDGKTQVTVAYEDGRPVYVDTIVISTQHDEAVDLATIRKDMIEKVIKEIVPAELLRAETKYFVNPTGKFVIGGPHGDSGLTGRKIIVDTYGGWARHGGGAFSGKDPSKVDRSAAYAMRWVAKNIVGAGLADRAEVQVAYAIGQAAPVGLYVETFGTEKVDPLKIEKAVREVFDLRPLAIINDLDLRRPVYKKTAAHGHFGRNEPEFTWERLDRVEALRSAVSAS